MIIGYFVRGPVDVDEMEVPEADHVTRVVDDRHRERLTDVIFKGRLVRGTALVEQVCMGTGIQWADVVGHVNNGRVSAAVHDRRNVVAAVKEATMLDKVKVGDKVKFKAEIVGGKPTVTVIEAVK